jgi:hypothetical protein
MDSYGSSSTHGWSESEGHSRSIGSSRTNSYSEGISRGRSIGISLSHSYGLPHSYYGDPAYITRKMLRDALEDLLIDLLSSPDRLDTWSARRWLFRNGGSCCWS